MLPQRIREARLDVKLSVVDMALKMGIKRQQVHRFEAGTSVLSIEQLCKIAEITSKRVSWFFGEEDIDDRLPSTKADIALVIEKLDAIQALLTRERD